MLELTFLCMLIFQRRKRRRKKRVMMSVRSYLCSQTWVRWGMNLWNRRPNWPEPTRGCCSPQEAWKTEPKTTQTQAHTPHNHHPSFMHFSRHIHASKNTEMLQHTYLHHISDVYMYIFMPVDVSNTKSKRPSHKS